MPRCSALHGKLVLPNRSARTGCDIRTPSTACAVARTSSYYRDRWVIAASSGGASTVRYVTPDMVRPGVSVDLLRDLEVEP